MSAENVSQQSIQTFEEHRGRMFGIAYRMLGSAMEAEDMVQEAYLRYIAVPYEDIQSHQAFLTTIVTRLCMDYLKSAKIQRETYIGPWLPEPILTDEHPELTNPYTNISKKETISIAFLVLLESLTATERAVFLLREVFDYRYAEIAKIIDQSETNCRKIFSRAKKHITENRPRFESTPEDHQQLLGKFIQAVSEGELEGLTNLLAETVTLWSDGGGKVQSATKPVHGAIRVAQFFLGLRRFAPEHYTLEIETVNGNPAIIMREENSPSFVLTIEVSESKITAFRVIRNPDKLTKI